MDDQTYGALMTTDREDQTRNVGQRNRSLWIAAVAAVLLIAAGGSAYALGRGQDSGIAACEASAERAAAGQRSDTSDDSEVQMLLDSEHADLREVGEALKRAEDGGLGDVMRVTVQMTAACARHGVIIDPTS